MKNLVIILKKQKSIIFLKKKVLFSQKNIFGKKLLFFYLFKILFNFGLFDFRIFYLLKKKGLK